MKEVDINIRRASVKDWKSITKLLFGLKSLYGSCEEDTIELFVNNYRDSVIEIIQSPQNYIWVALVNSKIVGFMSYTTRQVLRLRGKVIAMEELFVQKDYRRLGLALKMFQESTTYFKNEGLHHIEVVSSMAHKGQREWGRKIGLEWYSNIHRLKI